MAYVPINTQAYTAAFSGAVAGMAVNGWITSPTGANYTLVCGVAGAFAEAFDVAWNTATALNGLEYSAIQSVCSQEFSQRGPGPLAAPQFSDPANWEVPAKACATLALQCDLYFAGQGITPPVLTSPPAKVRLNTPAPPAPMTPGQTHVTDPVLVPYTLEADEVLLVEIYAVLVSGSLPVPATSYWKGGILLELSTDGGSVFNPIDSEPYVRNGVAPPNPMTDAPENFPVFLKYQLLPFDPPPVDNILRFRGSFSNDLQSTDDLSFIGAVFFTFIQGKLIP
jgi:hypothetical protein